MTKIKVVQVTFQRHGRPDVETRFFDDHIPTFFKMNMAWCVVTETGVEIRDNKQD